MSSPRCVLDLARWLAARLLSALTWPADGDAGELPVRDMPSRWRELSADSIAVANLAADQAADDVRCRRGVLARAAPQRGRLAAQLRAAHFRWPSPTTVACPPGSSRCSANDRGRRATRRCSWSCRCRRAWREAGRRGRRIGNVDLIDTIVARKRWQAISGAEAGTRALSPRS